MHRMGSSKILVFYDGNDPSKEHHQRASEGNFKTLGFYRVKRHIHSTSNAAKRLRLLRSSGMQCHESLAA